MGVVKGVWLYTLSLQTLYQRKLYCDDITCCKADWSDLSCSDTFIDGTCNSALTYVVLQIVKSNIFSSDLVIKDHTMIA